jgi:hypothetical protein
MPPLPGWAASDPACVLKFSESGGYGEMSVTSTALCGGAGTGPRVFNRVEYCPSTCGTDPGESACTGCMQGSTGVFGTSDAGTGP